MKPRNALRAQWHAGQELVQLSAARPVRVQHIPVQEIVLPHDHAYHEVGIIVSGKAMHVTAAGQAPLTAGTIFVIPPGEVHAMIEPEALEVVNVYYLSEWLMIDLGLLWTETGLVPLFLSNALIRHDVPHIEQLVVDMTTLASLRAELAQITARENEAISSPLFIRSCFLKFASIIARSWVEQSPTSGVLPFRKEVWSGMEAVERAVLAGRTYSVSDNAESIGLSTDYFSNLFRHSTGFSPTDYFQRRRIHRACQLLLDPFPSITSVAAELGYSDAPHFCRFFKRYRGVSPTEYRHMYGVR